VKRSIHLCRLLALFLIVGLVVAPLSARANAGMHGSMAMVPVADDAASMSAGEPCCADDSAPMDCSDCPLMAICMVTTLHAPSAPGVAEILPLTVRMLLPASDPEAESLGYSPPPKPPRFLVLSA
jgi:hypothetical protein